MEGFPAINYGSKKHQLFKKHYALELPSFQSKIKLQVQSLSSEILFQIKIQKEHENGYYEAFTFASVSIFFAAVQLIHDLRTLGLRICICNGANRIHIGYFSELISREIKYQLYKWPVTIWIKKTGRQNEIYIRDMLFMVLTSFRTWVFLR